MNSFVAGFTVVALIDRRTAHIVTHVRDMKPYLCPDLGGVSHQ